MTPKLLIITGPTATGKTDLGIKLAKRFNGELIACDSRQVYLGLDLGTGKYPERFESLQKLPGQWIVDGVSIHGYDLINPTSSYNVVRYVAFVKKVLRNITDKNKLPIIVGGTGLYLKALLSGIEDSSPPDLKLRQDLATLNIEQLQEKLKTLNKEALVLMNESDSKNPRRLARAIEKALDGNTQTKILGIEKDYDVFKIILTAPLAYLYERVDKRVASRMEQGMLAEARELNEKILSLPRMKQLGLEYGIMADYLSGVITTPTQLEGILKLKIRHFVKRQQTWFKKEKEGLWVDISKGYLDRVEKLVGKWYDTKA